jgi:hypothetical protein
MRQILIEKAKDRETISYSELSSEMQTVSIHHRSRPFNEMLKSISKEEDDAEHGMLTVIVIYKYYPKLPGGKFFDLAKELGHNISDKRIFWKAELDRVYNYWASH